jgi:dihydrofolate synthase/folylpolyglutamate synthase
MITAKKRKLSASSGKRKHEKPTHAKVARLGAVQSTKKKAQHRNAAVAVALPVKPLPALPVENKAYSKAIDFLMGHTDYERMRVVRYNTTTFNLDRMRQLLEALGNPHQSYKTIHIAGTKGKGSTCHMLAAMLRSAGFKVGLYTSPHLLNLRERICVSGEHISEEQFALLMKRIEVAMKKLGANKPTFFEILTAMGFSHFADQQVDIAVIETGLGGRLDSTNVITPEVTAITNISYDHMAVLGNSLSKIAEEKAGIFKKDIPALSCLQEPEVASTLSRIAQQVHAPLEFVGTDIEFSHRFEVTRPAGPHVRVSLTTQRSHFEHLTVPLIGEHQAVNCGLALAILDKLKARGLQFSDTKAVSGLHEVNLPGRIETVWQDPRVIIDGAHNAASVKALFRGISQYIPYDSMVVIFGCNCDKDIDGMLEQVSLGADKVIFTRSHNNPKSASPDELSARYVDRFGKMAQATETFSEAMDIATRAISREDLVAVTGSFYLIGEAKRFFMGRTAQALAGAAV